MMTLFAMIAKGGQAASGGFSARRNDPRVGVDNGRREKEIAARGGVAVGRGEDDPRRRQLDLAAQFARRRRPRRSNRRRRLHRRVPRVARTRCRRRRLLHLLSLPLRLYNRRRCKTTIQFISLKTAAC